VKNKLKKNQVTGSVAQVVASAIEFNPQYCQKKERRKKKGGATLSGN
jgi:hypothetical protein